MNASTQEIIFSENNPIHNNEDGRMQYPGICFWTSTVTIVLVVLFLLIFNPVYGALGAASLMPAIIILTVLYVVEFKRINIELLFASYWSGMLSVAYILVVEIVIGAVFAIVLINMGIVKIPLSYESVYKIILVSHDLDRHTRIIASAFNSFIVASLVEETAKFIIGLILHTTRYRLFYTHPAVTMIYVATGALGLACIENAAYVITTAYDVFLVNKNPLVSLSTGLATMISRVIVALPLHIITGLIIGNHMFLKNLNRKNPLRNYLQICLLPILIHGIFDFIVFGIDRSSVFAAEIGLAVIVMLYIACSIYISVMYSLVVQQWRSEIVNEAISDESELW
jgi:hypothetical protein